MTTTPAEARRTLVIGGPPTTNGDLHVGHVAGPYVGADVHVRHLRATGHDVVFASGGDDSQTYCTTTAARRGTTARELTTRSWGLIKGTFEAIGVDLDGFAPTDEGYRASVYDYVNRLHALGRFRLRTVRLPYSEATGRFLVEGLVGGDCPHCLADSRGAICESCGLPIDFDGLLDPWSILDPADPVTYREAEILVFPMEEYRERLIAYHRGKQTSWRPRAVAYMRELLSKPLPDFAITYPLDWGMPAPFAETPGQVLNAWLEGMPASMYCHYFARRALGEDPPSIDDAWRAEHDARLLFFVGFDNLYIWAGVHVAELLAHEGRYILPDTLLCNEFYELENDKFSTSKGHLVWTRDLVAEVPRDIVRFYLNLTAPEFSRTNFGRDALEKVAGQRLVTPWNELGATLAKLTAHAGAEGEVLPVSARGRANAALIAERFRRCLDLRDFSLSLAADLIAQHLGRLRGLATTLTVEHVELDRHVLRTRLGDLYLQLRALIIGASPILIDAAAESARSGGFALRHDAAALGGEIRAFTVPNLSTRVAPRAPSTTA